MHATGPGVGGMCTGCGPGVGWMCAGCELDVCWVWAGCALQVSDHYMGLVAVTVCAV